MSSCTLCCPSPAPSRSRATGEPSDTREPSVCPLKEVGPLRGGLRTPPCVGELACCWGALLGGERLCSRSGGALGLMTGAATTAGTAGATQGMVATAAGRIISASDACPPSVALDVSTGLPPGGTMSGRSMCGEQLRQGLLASAQPLWANISGDGARAPNIIDRPSAPCGASGCAQWCGGGSGGAGLWTPKAMLGAPPKVWRDIVHRWHGDWQGLPITWGGAGTGSRARGQLLGMPTGPPKVLRAPASGEASTRGGAGGEAMAMGCEAGSMAGVGAGGMAGKGAGGVMTGRVAPCMGTAAMVGACAMPGLTGGLLAVAILCG